MVYNEAGLLKTKYLHSQSNLAFLQKIDYKYNIRGWLTGINDPGLTSGEGDRFGLKLYYNRNTDGSTAFWNGNIRTQKWANGGLVNQINTYTYDHANRIKSGNYLTGSNPSNSFLSTYAYDKNGNFTYLTRKGFSGSFIDQITYGYKGGASNRLDYATDASGDIAGVEDFPGTLTGPNHLQYDANGNLTRDDYRAIDISYNLFNLPNEFDFDNNNKISYIYNGAGQKIAKEVSDGINPAVHTDYLGQFVHQYTVGGTSSLKYILTPEGRLKNSGTNSTTIWTWEYNLTDHLGNVRVVFRPGTSNTAEVIECNNYFPFGMKMTPYLCQTVTDNKYLYNGKELQTDFGLNWYDYSARFYDPTIGRWMVTDPLMELHSELSPYIYCANNPIKFVDPNGLDWVYRNVNGVTEAYYDRDIKSQDDINKKYGDKTGVTHMSDGTTLTSYDEDGKVKSQYTFTNDSRENKYGTVTDINGEKLDNTEITYGSNYTIFGTSDESCNAETLHKNYMGTSYTGPDNPKDYDGYDSFQYQPRNKSEYASMIHDIEYQEKQASGVKGALFDTRVLGADMRLAARNGLTALNPFVPAKDRLRALATYEAFGAISIFKIELLILKGSH